LLAGFRSPFLVSLALFVCLCTHELGHAVAGWLTGGTVTQFALFSLPPHVRIAGSASPAQEAVRDAASSLTYLLVYAIFALATRRVRGEWELVRYAASLFALVEILGWILSSFLGTSIMGPNDADDFLAASGASPYLLAGSAAAVGVLGAIGLRLLAWPGFRAETQLPADESVLALAKAAG
jgi:hypothetical protein